jgi:hypothetical protein
MGNDPIVLLTSHAPGEMPIGKNAGSDILVANTLLAFVYTLAA